MDSAKLVNPVTSEVDYDTDEVEFIRAIERYRRENRRPFPTSREVLAVLKSLGYRRVEEATNLPRFKQGRNGKS